MLTQCEQIYYQSMFQSNRTGVVCWSFENICLCTPNLSINYVSLHTSTYSKWWMYKDVDLGHLELLRENKCLTRLRWRKRWSSWYFSQNSTCRWETKKPKQLYHDWTKNRNILFQYHIFILATAKAERSRLSSTCSVRGLVGFGQLINPHPRIFLLNLVYSYPIRIPLSYR